MRRMMKTHSRFAIFTGTSSRAPTKYSANADGLLFARCFLILVLGLVPILFEQFTGFVHVLVHAFAPFDLVTNDQNNFHNMCCLSLTRCSNVRPHWLNTL